MPGGRTPTTVTWDAFQKLSRAYQRQQQDIVNLRRHLAHQGLRRHDAVWMPPATTLFRGITDEAATKHSSTTYTVSRYNPGTTEDSGTNDEVIFELIDVGSGKVVHYFKSGDNYYMTSCECPNT